MLELSVTFEGQAVNTVRWRNGESLRFRTSRYQSLPTVLVVVDRTQCCLGIALDGSLGVENRAAASAMTIDDTSLIVDVDHLIFEIFTYA